MGRRPHEGVDQEVVMVKVTDRAKIALKTALSGEIDEAGVGLRLEMSGQGVFELYPDRKKAGDQVVEHDGDVLLLLAEEVSGPLEGATIDFAETPEGAHLILSGAPRLPQDGP